jgi:hypothetical protein
LPRIKKNSIAEWKSWLGENHGDHPKRRSFEFLARMGVIAEAFTHAKDPDASEADILVTARGQIESILANQRQSAMEANAEASLLANLIHTLIKDSQVCSFSGHDPFAVKHLVDVVPDDGCSKIIATAQQLFLAFSAISRKYGLRGFDVRNPRSLSARLMSERANLKNCGIEIDVKGKKNKTNIYEIRVNNQE